MSNTPTQCDLSSQELEQLLVDDTLVENDDDDCSAFVDTRYLSYARFYIHQILSADLDAINRFKGYNIKINGNYYNRVCVVGMITNVSEFEKSYKLTVDDSTGCIRSTLWKTNIFAVDALNTFATDDAALNERTRSAHRPLFGLLDSIKSTICKPDHHNSIVYEPAKGDRVIIRGTVDFYQQELLLKIHSIASVKSMHAELMHMVMPAILGERVYAVRAPSGSEYEQTRKRTEEEAARKQVNREIKCLDKENVQSMTLQRIKQLTIEINKTTGDLNNPNKLSRPTQSVSVFSLFRSLKSSFADAFKHITQMQILNELKELEEKGLVYSCEDEFHYLPV